jgi:hypothetical protein
MPGGATLRTQLWSLDEARQRLSFSVDVMEPQLPTLLQEDEAVAVAYLDSVKLQFDVQGLCLVRSLHAAALQCSLPQDIFRFQRRNAFRVRPGERQVPMAALRHPSMPEMVLRLRVLDLSIGGCALWVPTDVPPLQPGTLLSQVEVHLDADTRFSAAMTLQHVSAIGPGDHRAQGDAHAGRPLVGRRVRGQHLQRHPGQQRRVRRARDAEHSLVGLGLRVGFGREGLERDREATFGLIGETGEARESLRLPAHHPLRDMDDDLQLVGALEAHDGLLGLDVLVVLHQAAGDGPTKGGGQAGIVEILARRGERRAGDLQHRALLIDLAPATEATLKYLVAIGAACAEAASKD